MIIFAQSIKHRGTGNSIIQEQIFHRVYSYFNCLDGCIFYLVLKIKILMKIIMLYMSKILLFYCYKYKLSNLILAMQLITITLYLLERINERVLLRIYNGEFLQQQQKIVALYFFSSREYSVFSLANNLDVRNHEILITEITLSA